MTSITTTETVETADATVETVEVEAVRGTITDTQIATILDLIADEQGGLVGGNLVAVPRGGRAGDEPRRRGDLHHQLDRALLSTRDTRGQMMTTTWSEMRSYATATADQYTAASYGAARAYCAALFDGDEIETTGDMLNRIRCEQRVASQALTEARQAHAAATDLLDTAEDEGMDPQLAGVIRASVEGEREYQQALWDVLDAAADHICSIIEPVEVY